MSDTDVAPATGKPGTAKGAPETRIKTELAIKAARLIEHLVDGVDLDEAGDAGEIIAAGALLTNANLSASGLGVNQINSLVLLAARQTELLVAMLDELKSLNASMDLDDVTVDALATAAGAGEVVGA